MELRKAVARAIVLAMSVIASCNSHTGGFPSDPSPQLTLVAGKAGLPKDGVVPSNGWGFYVAKMSPDGRRVATICTAPDSGTPRLALIIGNRPKQISDPKLNVDDAAWMPDSRSLLIASSLTSQEGAFHSSTLSIVDLSGETIRQLHLNKEFRIAEGQAGLQVRPDGRRAVMAIWPPGGMSDAIPELAVVDLQTGNVQQLTDTPDVGEFDSTWLDDDHLLTSMWAYDSARRRHGWISLFDIRTGSARRLTPPNQTASSPTVLFEAKKFFYSAYSTDGSRDEAGIWMMPSTGGHPRFVQTLDAPDPRITPDGAFILAAEVGTPGEPGPIRLVPLPGKD